MQSQAGQLDQGVVTRGSDGQMLALMWGGQLIAASDLLSGAVDYLPQSIAGRFEPFPPRQSIDLYGWDAEQSAIVVRVRDKGRKRYFLAGDNESCGSAYCVPVSSQSVQAGIRVDPSSAAAPVHSAQRSAWGVTERQRPHIICVGDLVLSPKQELPVRHWTGPFAAVTSDECTVLCDHVAWDAGGNVFVKNFELYLSSGRFQLQCTREGSWFRVHSRGELYVDDISSDTNEYAPCNYRRIEGRIAGGLLDSNPQPVAQSN